MIIAEKIMISTGNLFQRALSYLVINSDFMPNIGLFHGKMGLVLFFSVYARFSKNELYNQFAYDLLDEVYEDIHKDILLDFENGLCGIGWAIEFLVQNGYMEGDTDEILEDVDKHIMQYNVCRISDLSFRNGLAGIVYYVCARLSTFRRNDVLPFDLVFLENLKDALLSARFSEADEVPPCLIETYLNVLRGVKPERLDILVFLQLSDLQIPKEFQSVPLGLKDGLTGILLKLILNQVRISETDSIFCQEKKRIVIFNEESRAANYGVGTYIKLLVDAFKSNRYEIVVVHLHSPKVNSILVERIDNITEIHIANSKGTRYNQDWKKQNERYYRNVILLLNSYLDDTQEYIFQLNYMETEKLAKALKVKFPYSRIVMTVHYTNWCFTLSGDKDRLREILNQPENKENEQLLKSIRSEKLLLDACDRVIGISKHSYDNLLNIYKIPEHKLVLIPHALKDSKFRQTKIDKKELRRKYGFKEKELLLIFAGRLDVDKGVEVLAESFIELQKRYSQLRLIVAGEGNYNVLFPKLTFGWSKVVFTGFVDKNILYELFSIADIGVLPSFYEEFGYVALEMMMMELPLVVSRTSGLSELVIDGVSGITVTLNKKENDENCIALQTAIKELLDNPSLRKQYAKNGRLHFLQNYNFEMFVQQTRTCFEGLSYIK